MKTIIISAFPGMGKSYSVQKLPQYKLLDLESSDYSWLKTDQGKICNPLFPQNYVDRIQELVLQGSYQVIFVSSHKCVRQALQYNKIKYYLIYPDMYLKDEYIRRFRQRGNDQEFIKLLNQNFKLWINQIQEEQYNKYCNKTKVMQKNFYLTDLFREKRS